MADSVSVKQNASDFASNLLTKLKAKSDKPSTKTKPTIAKPAQIIKGRLGLGADEKQKDAERNTARGRTSAKLKKGLHKRNRKQAEDEEEEADGMPSSLVCNEYADWTFRTRRGGCNGK
jgi:hypothetical protein